MICRIEALMIYAGFTMMGPMDSIMVCVDFSKLTNRVVETAVDYASCCGLPVHVVHVRTGASGVKHVVTSDQYGTIRRAKAMKESEAFDSVVDAVRKTGLKVTSHISGGQIVDVIVEQAKKVNPKIIVMGSHGTGAMYHLIVGSVAGGVLNKLSVPVLLVPGEKEDSSNTASA
jgi:nucleotide-binding universal stress UspA family protein